MLSIEQLVALLEEKSPLQAIVREGVREVIETALQLEAKQFIEKHQEVLPDGKNRLVLNGTHQERSVTIALGPVSIKAPRLNDRGQGLDKLEFNSKLIPKYLTRAGSVETLIPWLYLMGISERSFKPLFETVYGEGVKGFSSSTVSHLVDAWGKEYQEWEHRDMSHERYAYLYGDGVYFKVKGETENACLLTLLGVDEDGKKRLVGLSEGFAESKESWRSLIIGLKHRNMPAPKLMVGDAGLGLWSSLSETYPDCQTQICWFHAIKAVRSWLPKSLQHQAVCSLRNIYLSSTRAEAAKQIKLFDVVYGVKHPKATAVVTKRTDGLLAFFDYPAQHWAQLRTTNPIESMFSTLKLRTGKTRGNMSRGRLLSMVFKLAQTAAVNMNAICGADKMKLVLEGRHFKDGELMS
jgi:transposase-like protein